MAALNRIVIVGLFFYFHSEQILGGPTSIDTASCSSICKSTFQEFEQGLCIRGCRLMSVLAYFHGPLMSLNELRDSCNGACLEAYANMNASSCAFGCQSQLPAIEMQRDEKSDLMTLDDSILGLPQRFVDYSNRMMSCMLDHINHQVSVGWVSITSYVSSENGNRIVIIEGSAPIQFIEPSHEHKTSNYVETNLAVHDGSATPDLKQSQLASMDLINNPSSLSINVNEGTYYQADWLSCLSAKTRLSKETILLILFTMLLVLVWFLIGACFPATRQSTEAQPKLSIYGDLESLSVYDEKYPMIASDRKFCINNFNAPPLPQKMQEI